MGRGAAGNPEGESPDPTHGQTRDPARRLPPAGPDPALSGGTGCRHCARRMVKTYEQWLRRFLLFLYRELLERDLDVWRGWRGREQSGGTPW